MVQFKSLAQLVEEAAAAVAVDVNGVKMIDLDSLSAALKKVQLVNQVRVAILPDGPPDPGAH